MPAEAWPAWPRNNQKLLARYAGPEAAHAAMPSGFFPLGAASSHDLRTQRRLQEIVESIYDKLCGVGIDYDLEPLRLEDPANTKQAIRSPAEVVRDRRGTCLDLALLFAALCLGERLLPMVVLLGGGGAGSDHALVVVDLQYTADEWQEPRGLKDAYRAEGLISGKAGRAFIREQLQAKQYMAVECTGFAATHSDGRHTPRRAFEDACAKGIQQIEAGDHIVTLDIAALQAKGETPYPDTSAVPNRLRPVHYNLPFLPPNYQERPEAVRVVKGQLLGEARTIGVHGMAGIGKTVLATALVRDKEVDGAFPNGIAWLNFGREAEATQKQAELALALTGETHSFQDPEEGRGQLSQLTETDQLLVVLDDVWRIEQYDAFSRLGPDCRLLVTTRDRRILERLGGVGHELQLLSPEAALEMLAGTTKSSPTDLPVEAPKVAKECGYLPLALASIGGLIAKGRFGWPEALGRLRRADLKRLATILPDYKHEGVLAALQVSVDALEPPERECFLDCAVFREDVVVPEAPLLRLWSARFDDPEDARDVAFRLVEFTLLRREQSQTEDTRHYRLHDLYHDYLVHAAAPLQPRHASLLQAYERDCPDGWASFPEDDSYFIDWIPYHLIGAGRSDECRDILFDLGWLRHKLSARDVNAMIADTALFSSNGEVETLGRALRMSAHVFNRDKRQLTAHLFGRLRKEDGNRTARLLDTASHEISAGVLVPRGGNHLWPPGQLLRTLEGHAGPVTGAVVFADSARALSWAGGEPWGETGDRALRLWDLESGANRVLEGHSAPVTGAVVFADGARALSWAGGSELAWDSDEYRLCLWDLESGASRALEGHSAPVAGAVVLADGARALSWAGEEHTINDVTLRLWDLESGASRALEGHSTAVTGAVALADGVRALSWSADGGLRLWDLESGTSCALKGYRVGVGGAVVLADGARVLTWYRTLLRLWDLSTGASLALKGHRDLVYGAVVLTDGARALSWSEDGTLRLWDLTSGASRALEGHSDRVSGALVLADGARALSWSKDRTLRLWDLATAASRALEGHSAAVFGAVLLSDGARALSWSEDGTLRLWDLTSGASRALEGHSDRVSGALVLADGARALSWSKDRTLRLWDLASSARRVLEGHSDRVVGAVLLADGARALSWSKDRTLRLWELSSGTNWALEGHSAGVTGAVLLADGTRTLSWAGGGTWEWEDSGDHALRLWDLATGASRALEGHSAAVTGAVVLTGDARALSWSTDCTLRLWDLSSGASRALKGHRAPVRGAVVLADGAHALSWAADWDHTLRLWDLGTGASRALRGHRAPVRGAVVLADGARALSWSSQKRTLRLWNLSSGASRALDGHSAPVTSAVVLPDGARALSWSRDGTLRLWDLSSGASRALDGHSDAVSGAVLLADGARALSWSWDGTLRLWDLASGEGRSLEGHSAPVTSAVVLPDGARALSWSRDGTLRRWDLRSLQELACFVGDDPLTCCVVNKDEKIAVVGDSRGRVMCFDLPA